MMQTSHYTIPRCDSEIWTDWLLSERVTNSSWNTTATTLVDDSDVSDSQDIEVDPLRLCYPFQTPPSLDGSFSSRLSIASASDHDELPEIPFISSTSLRYHNGWSQTHDHEHCQSSSDDTNSERSFWGSIIRPSTSQSSDRSIAVFGHLNERVLAPKRRRAPSVSSNASSRTRPAPAKSILSSSSSIRTKTGRSPPSVKFLDMPTIHFEEEEYESDPQPVVTQGKRERSFLRWFWGSSKKSQPAQEHPTISGPFPLWETPSRRIHEGAASLRSTKSSSSLRSMRSYSSRLQTYWSRVTGKDP